MKVILAFAGPERDDGNFDLPSRVEMDVDATDLALSSQEFVSRFLLPAWAALRTKRLEDLLKPA